MAHLQFNTPRGPGRVESPAPLETERPPPSAARTSSVSEVMVRTVICAHPEMPVAELIQVMVDHCISAVPVVDSSGYAIGMVSQHDILRELRENPEAAGAPELEDLDFDEESLAADLRAELGTGRCARHIMTPLALSVPETTSIARAAALMAYERIHRVLVVDSQRAVVGIISALDVVRWLARGDGYAIP